MTNPTPPTSKPRFTVSVRDLVELTSRTGNLAANRDFSPPTRALQGTRAHQRLQKSRPPSYETEVHVQRIHDDGEFILEIRGRIDGLQRLPSPPLLEEIKTVQNSWDGQPDPLHWAQAKIYGALLLQTQPDPVLQIQLTYFHLDSSETTPFKLQFPRSELLLFFEQTLNEYLTWIRDSHRWQQQRNASLLRLAFPFRAFRPGQRTMAVAVYRCLRQRRSFFAEAPTGIGKTLSVLFPALKILGEGAFEKLFYLTAKTVGGWVAAQTLAQLRRNGLNLRALTLTAKDKICFSESPPCDPSQCPFALGYFDRRKPALQALLKREDLNREAIEEISRQYQVCPFQLSLDAAPWVDLIVCDYNYVFDPSACLKQFFSEENGPYAFLVDEAHNLVERARDMFSASLQKEELWELRTALKTDLPGCAQALHRLNRFFAAWRKAAQQEGSLVLPSLPGEWTHALRNFLTEAEAWLAQQREAPYRPALLNAYFQALRFSRLSELDSPSHVPFIETNPQGARLRLFCLDPAPFLKAALKRGQAAIFFSATLTPLVYYQQILGGALDDPALQLRSPFPSENLALLISNQIQTTFKRRETTHQSVAESIAALVSARRGNYLVFFSSYQYMRPVLDLFSALLPTCRTLPQRPNMTETERQSFLAAFQENPPETLVGFAVLGGLFSEGIDLLGDRLIGAAVVGVGLPQLCLERNLIRDYYQSQNGQGFNYAYLFPGWNRVLQALGRVIRSETDRGAVLLIDARFSEPRYQKLFPPWWNPVPIASPQHAAGFLRDFWAAPEPRPSPDILPQ